MSEVGLQFLELMKFFRFHKHNGGRLTGKERPVLEEKVGFDGFVERMGVGFTAEAGGVDPHRMKKRKVCRRESPRKKRKRIAKTSGAMFDDG